MTKEEAAYVLNLLKRQDLKINSAATEAIDLAISALEKQEQAKNEWCPDCAEYDKERHCCHRFTKVIRQTVEECKREWANEGWIPVKERLPKCEQEVLICTKKKTYIHEKSGFEWCVNPIVTPAMYEDGTMLEVDSKWHWEDCDWAGWDEEEDCGIIPEGWWENSQFNPDGEYNHAIDVEVVAWRPLPEPYTEEES